MVEEDFSKTYTDAGLCVKQIRIKPDKRILGQRKSIVEHPFGTIKRSMDAAYCLTRRLQNVAGEFSLTFLAYNLKRVITILGCKKLMECLTG
jgi:transposase